MSTVKRTPPNKKQTEKPSQTHTSSESDIGSAVLKSDFVNTNRNKRLRSANSPQGGSTLNSQILQDTLSIWTEEQDSKLSTILAEQTTLINKLVADIGEIKAQNSHIKASNDEIRKSNEEMKVSMTYINKQFEDLKREVEELRKERQDQQRYIENLELKIIDLQHKSRSSGIELRNIPQDNMEHCTTLRKTVCKPGTVVGVNVTDCEIRDIYRLPGKSPNPATPRPIIVKFTSVQKKQALISAVRSYNTGKPKQDKTNTSLIGIPGECLSVYIAEQLPGNTNRLFYQAREFAKKNAFKYCWISNGNIFLRKCEGDRQILINFDKSLQDMGNQNI